MPGWNKGNYVTWTLRAPKDAAGRLRKPFGPMNGQCPIPDSRALKDAARRLRKPFGLMNGRNFIRSHSPRDRRLAVGLVGSKRAECNSALRRQPSPAPSPLDKSVQTSPSPQGLRRETESV